MARLRAAIREDKLQVITAAARDAGSGFQEPEEDAG
jgi:hypothetical protein